MKRTFKYTRLCDAKPGDLQLAGKFVAENLGLRDSSNYVGDVVEVENGPVFREFLAVEPGKWTYRQDGKLVVATDWNPVLPIWLSANIIEEDAL